MQRFDPKTLEYRPSGGDPEIAKLTKSLSKIENPRERLKKLMADLTVLREPSYVVLRGRVVA